MWIAVLGLVVVLFLILLTQRKQLEFNKQVLDFQASQLRINQNQNEMNEATNRGFNALMKVYRV